jgi:two-component system, LytTR family, sensor kinase
VGWWLLQTSLLYGFTPVPPRSAENVPFITLVFLLLSDAATWIPVYLFALWISYRLFDYVWARLLPRGMVYVLCALGVSIYRSTLLWLTTGWDGSRDPTDAYLSYVTIGLANNVTRFLLFVGVGTAFVLAQRERIRDRLAARAELHYLKAQLQPHFLFNALNAISGTVVTEPQRAKSMIAGLGNLLRRVLEHDGATEVPLREELQVLEAYLEIEQVRFADRLVVTFEIEDEAKQACVPHLLLQPLVENAVRHGIAPRPTLGQVKVSARRVERRLLLTIEDDGVGMRGSGSVGAGVGLANTRSRLQHLYGSEHQFSITDVAPHGVRVEIRLPWQPWST